MTIKKYNKLVRDKIPEIIFNTGSTPKVYIANELQYSEHLKKKLQEEVQEFLEDPCVQELADIQEVILSIATMNKDIFSWRLMMVSKKDQIKLLDNLHRSYSESLSENISEETKAKIKNLLEMIEAVTNSLKREKHETRIQRIANRIKGAVHGRDKK
jgi:predicted house-cleaning noncanonical NTP pyrophosphatase (MazG superfamily)